MTSSDAAMSGALPPATEPARHPRPAEVLGGLLLTFGGLLFLVLLAPASLGALPRGLLWLALGALGLWVGGILMGHGMGTPPRRRRPL